MMSVEQQGAIIILDDEEAITRMVSAYLDEMDIPGDRYRVRTLPEAEEIITKIGAVNFKAGFFNLMIQRELSFPMIQRLVTENPQLTSRIAAFTALDSDHPDVNACINLGISVISKLKPETWREKFREVVSS